MPTYKGNVGNLMQHWTLCELLNIAQDRGIPGLNFIDAHAMAPLARTKDSPDGRFNHVEARVQQPHEPDHEWASKYEWAWHHLAPSVGYPNSAVFVERIWTREFSLSFCELDWSTIAELGTWRDRIRSLGRCTNAELFPGDWRDSLAQLPFDPADVGLPAESLTLVSFDPYMYNSRRRFAGDLTVRNPGNVYPDDLWAVLVAMMAIQGRVLIQLSTYSANDGNRPRVIEASVNLALIAAGFRQAVPVRFNGEMVSLISARGLDRQWLAQLQALPLRFTDWARAIPG